MVRKRPLGEPLAVEALLVLLVPLGLVSVRVGELVRGSRARLLRLAGARLACLRPASTGDEDDRYERHDDHGHDDPRDHGRETTGVQRGVS